MTSGRWNWLVLALTATAMIVAPWVGFLSARPTVDLLLLAMASGILLPLLLLRSPIERVAGAGLALIGLFPALVLSEVLAHLSFGGCLQ